MKQIMYIKCNEVYIDNEFVSLEDVKKLICVFDIDGYEIKDGYIKIKRLNDILARNLLSGVYKDYIMQDNYSRIARVKNVDEEFYKIPEGVYELGTSLKYLEVPKHLKEKLSVISKNKFNVKFY